MSKGVKIVKQTPIVLITGISGHVGGSLCRHYLHKGWKVIGTVQNGDAFNFISEKFSEEIELGTVTVIKFDASQREFETQNFHEVFSSFGLPTALINNAATDSLAEIPELEQEEFEKILRVNLISPTLLASMFARIVHSAKQTGSVVTISSLLGSFGASASSAYAASKAGLEAFSRCLAIEGGTYGVRSNVVRIGGCKHRLRIHNEAIESYESRYRDQSNESTNPATIPLQRMGELSDYCGIIYFLTNSEASFITGQVISVDGGLSTMYPGYTSPRERIGS